MQRLSMIILRVLVLVHLATPAAAQMDDLPPISRQQIESYARILDLNEEQIDIAFVLHEGYLQAVSLARAEMGSLEDELRRRFEDGDPSELADPQRMQEIMREAMETASEQFRTMIRLQHELLDDIRVTLSEQQDEQWPRVVRKRQRDLLMRQGLDLSWSSVDLVDTLDRIGPLETSEELNEAVVRYERDVDRPLGRLYALMVEVLENLPEIMADAMSGQGEMIDFQEKAYKGMGEVRSINKRHARIIATLLSDSDRVRFEEENKKRAFPRVYAPSHVAQAISTAAGFADLTDDQATSIDAIGAQYDRELDSANIAWAAVIDTQDEDYDLRDRNFSFGGPETPVDHARKAREELDETFRKRLEAMLTPEQRERLPEERRQWRGPVVVPVDDL